jgi:hypothetical protein
MRNVPNNPLTKLASPFCSDTLVERLHGEGLHLNVSESHRESVEG